MSYGSIKDHSDTLTNLYLPNVYARDRYINNSVRYSGLLNYKINNKATVRTGMVGSLLGYDLSSLSFRKDLSRLTQFIDDKGHTYLLQGYGQLKYDFSDNFFINTGLHVNYFGLSEKFTIEPRLGLNYLPNENSTLSLGMGLHSRVEPMMLYFGKSEKPDGSVIQSNSKLDLTKSAHFVLGYEIRAASHLKIKTETYYQKMYDVPVGIDPNYPISTLNIDNSYILYNRNYSVLTNQGTGSNYGIELSVERNLLNGMYFMASSSFFNSTFNTIEGKTFDTNYNGKYAGNIVFGKEYKAGKNDKNLFGVNIKTVLNGGRRYTPINLPESIKADYPVLYEEQINTKKVQDYYRFDFSVNYRVNRSNVNHFFILDTQNVTNRQNMFTQIYNSDKKIIENIFHTGIIPTFNYKIQF
jgi:hypothetical protein